MAPAATRLRVLLGPAGSAGDVHPFVGVGKALRARGHEVIVLTCPYFRKVVERAGLRLEPVSSVEALRAAMEDPDLWHPWRGYRVLLRALGPAIREVYEKTVGLVAPGRTVIAGQWGAFGMRLAAEKLRVPMATVHLQPAAFVSAYRAPDLPLPGVRYWPLAARRLLVRVLERLGDRMLNPIVRPLRRDVGLPPASRAMTGWSLSPDRVIGLFPEWYGVPQPDWPPQTRLTGFPLYDEGDAISMPEEVAELLDAGSAPVVFTPGSACLHGRPFFEAGAEACTRLGRRGLLLTRHREQLPPELPEGVRHFDYVPFGRLLPRCAALVHHGGIGTTAQGLAAGIPQLVMPMAFDQPDNAARLRAFGVGSSLSPRRFVGPAVARELGALLDSGEVAERCRTLAQRLREGDPVTPTCELIEALIG